MKTYFFYIALILGIMLPLQSYSQSEDLQQLENDMRGSSGANRVEKLIYLADVYHSAGNYDKAEDLASEASDLARKIGKIQLQAMALNREGKALAASGKRNIFGKEKASGKFKDSYELARRSSRPNKALMLDNLEQLRAIAEHSGRAGDLADIEAQIARANDLAETLPPPPPATPDKPLTEEAFKQEISTLFEKINANQETQQITSKQRQNIERQFATLRAEQEAYKAQIDQMNENQAKAALALMQQRFVVDSLKNQASIKSLEMERNTYALSETENKYKFFLAAFVAMLLLVGGTTYSMVRARHNGKILAEKNKIIRAEQERSENLLLNILPALVADELKKRGRTSARYFDDVSVLFADFVGFSQIAEKLTPQQLVSELDTCFQAFDEIIAKYNLEKIKTIGDAYMVAGGLPNGGGSQLKDMINAARDMQAWLAHWNEHRAERNMPVFEARIGIHCGPVVAGVVGSKKFAFDIWGDTVNIASRIESAGEGGKINISGNVYEVVREYFPCHYRGKIPAKNKGEIDMYFVEN